MLRERNKIMIEKEKEYFFGKYLLDKKIINEKILDKVVKFQSNVNKKIGDIAIEKKYLTKLQVDEIYLEQKKTNKYFGEIAVGKKYLNKEQLDNLLKFQKESHLFIGEIFVALGYLTKEQMEKELEEYHKIEKARNNSNSNKIQQSHIEFVKLFIECSNNSIYRLIQLPLKISRYITKRKTIYTKGLMVKVSLNGIVNKTLVYNFDKEIIDAIILKFFEGFPKDKILTMKESALKELVNIISGLIVTELANKYNIEAMIEAPNIIKENSYTITDKEFLTLPFITPEGTFELNITS